MRSHQATGYLCALLAAARRRGRRCRSRARGSPPDSPRRPRRSRRRRARAEAARAPRRPCGRARRRCRAPSGGDRRLLRRARLRAVLDRSRQRRARPSSSRRSTRSAGAGAAAGALRRRRRSPRSFDAAATEPPAPARGGGDARLSRYASDLSAGVARPRRRSIPDITREPDAAGAGARCSRARRRAGAPRRWRASQPADPGLSPADGREGAARGAGADRAPGGRRWPTAPTLHPGETGPRVAELRARLARLGYSRRPARRPARTSTPALADGGGARSRRDYGLNDDGVVGAMTLAAVNAPVETRLAQVVVNLERMRWMTARPGRALPLRQHPRLHRHALSRTGSRGWELEGGGRQDARHRDAGVLRRGETMVVNPTWHIPDSIAIRDYLPKLQRDPMVLKRQNIDLMTRGGTEINPKLVDFTQYTPENFPFRIKQRPSDDNALGKVKFLFPNQHLGLHARHAAPRALRPRRARLLERLHPAGEAGRARRHPARRARSPIRQATLRRPGVAAARRRRWRSSGPIPVHIVYRTVTFDDAGARALPAGRLRPRRDGLRGARGGGRDFAGCAGLRLPL